MFLAIVFIAIGVAILLNAMGLMTINFWAIFFIAIGIKMLIKRGKCPMCGWHHWEGKMHNKIHDRMHDHCCEGHEHEEDHH